MIKYQIYNVADLSGNILHIVSQTDFAQTSECSQAKGGPSVNYSTEIKCKVCLSWCIMFGQPRCFKCLPFFLFFLPPTPSPLYNSHPRIYRHPLLWRGGGGIEGWPLLIQRLGICIWLLFVNQWCDCAGRRVSPRLSLSLCLSGWTLRALTHFNSENTITRKGRMRRYHAVTWNHSNSSLSTHEPSPLFLSLVLFPLCVIGGGDCVHRRGKTGMFLPVPKSVKTERKPVW